MPKRKKKQIPLSWVVGVAIPLITFLGGVSAKLWSVADSIATKSDIVQIRTDMYELKKTTEDASAKVLDLAKKYTDDKCEQVKVEAITHSDGNRSGMEVKYTSVDTKIGLILQMLDRLERTLENYRGRR
jgi:hypothetical protein